MYPTSAGLKFLVQQQVSGTGLFNGSEYGRARATLDPSLGANSIVYVASKLFGTASNAISVQLVDAGSGVAVVATTITQTGAIIKVNLRRTTGAVTATSQEVSDAINTFTTYSSPGYALGARAGGTGLGVVAAVAATPLTGGLNPTQYDGNQYLWTVTTNTSGGLFHFEHEEPLYVLGFRAWFTSFPGSGPYTLTVNQVRLDKDFTKIAAETVPVSIFDQLSPTKPDFAFSGRGDLILYPKQALTVVTNATIPGFVQIEVAKAPNFPYV
jgi:hypothetical protein